MSKNFDTYAAQQAFGTVNLGDWSNDQEVPWWLAIRILPAFRELSRVQAAVQNAVTLAAQDQLGLAADVLEDICPPPRKWPPGWPRPHGPQWYDVVYEVARFADSLPSDSVQRAAAFKLLDVGLGRFGHQEVEK
ncbi:MAG: hypothetical protein FIA97_18180 [Methylococcaceae bacterium]|nr:hypothetical protein [Methylococcaceae bacterium]